MFSQYIKTDILYIEPYKVAYIIIYIVDLIHFIVQYYYGTVPVCIGERGMRNCSESVAIFEFPGILYWNIVGSFKFSVTVDWDKICIQNILRVMSTLCLICIKLFGDEIAWIQHTEQVHGITEVYKGVRCWETSRDQSRYITTGITALEYKYHVDDTQYNSSDNCWNCPICSKQCMQKNGLENHLKSGVHEHSRYQCKDCNTKYITLGALTQHIEATGHAPRQSRFVRVIMDDAQQSLMKLTTGVIPTRFEATLYFDGSAKPNPGLGGSGVYIVDERQKVIFSGGRSVKRILCAKVDSNQAEYDGLIFGLEKAIEEGIKRLLVLGDSQLVINQMNGEYACRSERLISSYNRAKCLFQHFQKLEFRYIPRTENTMADRLAAIHRDF